MKHATISQTHQRSIIETLCLQKGCKFNGKIAQQGVCYSNKGELIDWAKLDAEERALLKGLAQMRKREGKQYVKALEAHYLSAMMNWQGTLDECIRLRRDNAMLKLKGTQ